MKRIVMHPSAFADWFPDGGAALRAEFEAGRLEIVVPQSFVADTLGELARRGWSRESLRRAATEVERIGFRVMQPPASELTSWLVRKLPASAASYAALASWLDVPIAVTDPELRRALRTLPQAVDA